jgi:hypothetical protein
VAQPFSTPLPRADRKAITGGGSIVETMLIAAGTDLRAHRHAHRLRSAIGELSQNAGMAACLACHRGLCTARPIGGILIAFAVPKARAITTSPFCLSCWREPLDERSRHAERALGRIIVGGKWLDPLPVDTS